MRLHYNSVSPYARKVLVAAHELGIADEIAIIEALVSPVMAESPVLADNPLGKIPCLVADDTGPLYDSRVICEYLGSLHEGTKLVPDTGPERWTVLRRQALADGIADASLLGRYETFIRPADKQWDGWIDGQERKVARALDQLESEVASFGDSVDLGLIAIATALAYRDFRFANVPWRDTRPKLAEWFEVFAKRLSMQATEPAAS